MKVIESECVVIGAGPGGYTAAFYAADLGIKTTLIERYSALGGVCLNVGCIPSKALLHIAALKEEAAEYEKIGLGIKDFKVDIAKLRAHKESIINKLVGGVKQLAKARKVTVLTGQAAFMDANNLMVTADDGTTTRVTFTKAIIAAGSRPVIPASLQNKSERVMTSTGALKLQEFPKRLLIVGGGIIGMEMGYMYASFGSEVTMVEALPELGTGIDRDVFRPLEMKLKKLFNVIQLNTFVSKLATKGKELIATFTPAGEAAKNAKAMTATFDRVLVSVGRRPNSDLLAIEKSGIAVDDKGFIIVDKQLRTSVPNIYAIGDIVGNPMLAHKASKEAHIAVEAILGKKTQLEEQMVIPNVLYTDPEVAWAGLTETAAKTQGIAYKKATFPWAASGRALAISKTAGG